MASLIPGFEYDIFISYRQKDNKGDRWVSEFVESLKTELESTFKEEITVYFDINPDDGLLETHDVDASLKDKLKCLVFIPIISRTYCDPKSFAWENEFTAFIELASKDQFELKIKLKDGNVANRVLPVRIHELDADDKKLVESVLGGFIRGIEFIYREPGVNRPLTSGDDEKKNLNGTMYRNQVNKVANAISEIIAGLRNPEHIGKGIVEKIHRKKPYVKVNSGTKNIIGVLLFLGLLVVGYYTVPKLFSITKQSEKSIAVLPFHNYSGDPDQEYMSDGLTDEIINHFYRIKSFDKVVSLSSVLTYKGTNKKIPRIADELKVSYILEGTYKRIGDRVRVNAQLVDPKSDRYLWQHEYDQPYNEIISIQADIALQIADQVKAFLTNSERQTIKKMPTVNPKAYNLYLQGRYLWTKRTKEGLLKSIDFFEKSVKEDPGYTLAYAGLADSYCILVFWDWYPREEGYSKAKDYALKAIKMDPDLAEAHAILGSVLLWGDWKWEEAGKELKLATELNPKCAIARQYYSEYLDITRNSKEAREQINIALELDPVSPAFKGTSALYYCNEGKFEESRDECIKTMEISPDYAKVYPLCFYSYLELGEDLKAVELFKQFLRLDTQTMKYANDLDEIFSKYRIGGVLNWIIQSELMKPEPSVINLAWTYSVLQKNEEAIKWLEIAYEKPPADLPRINNYIIFNNLRTDPRFQAIIKKMGLSEYQNLN